MPRLPISSSTTPFHASRPASVTTNDGTRIRATIEPWNRPIAVVHASAITMQSQPGRPGPSGVGCWSSAAIIPPTPLTKPIDRSISPSSSANVTPIAMTA